MFEGPLDLLLHLVKKHELSILDIPIAFVTEKYLEYLDAMAGARHRRRRRVPADGGDLCHIKSRELLPTPELDDEAAGDDGLDGEARSTSTRARDLIRRLLEYQKYKEAADQLGGRPVVGRNVWGRGAPTEDAVGEGVDADAVAPLAAFPVHKLIEAFDRVMRQAKLKVSAQRADRPAQRQPEDRGADRPARARRAGSRSRRCSRSCARASARTLEEVRHEAVVTFLALLEMAKLRLIALRQAGRRRGGRDLHRAGGGGSAGARASTVAGGDDYR